MRILVVGAGGVGGYFGARLALSGSDVTFAARGRHAEAMARDGLTVEAADGPLEIASPKLLEAGSGTFEAVLVCVKLWDLEATAELIRPHLAAETAVVPFQNGVAAADILAARLGPERVLNGIAQVSAAIVRPGVIRQTGTFARLLFGERDNRRSERAEALLADCQAAGIDAKIPSDIALESWRKFIFLAPIAGVCARRRQPLGAVLADPEAAAELRGLLAEAAAVGRASGIALPAEAEDTVFKAYAGLPADMKPSMLHDLEAGRRLELDWLTGEVVGRGRDLGLETPYSQTVYDALAPLRDGDAGRA